MVRLASVLRPRVQSLTVFSFFFTFHNFFFAFALPEKFAFGSKAQKKNGSETRRTHPTWVRLFFIFVRFSFRFSGPSLQGFIKCFA